MEGAIGKQDVRGIGKEMEKVKQKNEEIQISFNPPNTQIVFHTESDQEEKKSHSYQLFFFLTPSLSSLSLSSANRDVQA